MTTEHPAPAGVDVGDDALIEGRASSRFDAPIRYRDIRGSYNTMRAAGALALALGALVDITRGHSGSAWVLTAALVVAADAIYRRFRGDRALPLLLVDVTAISIALLARGAIPSIEAAAFAYVVTASLLVLGMRTAALVIAYAAAWSYPIGQFSPIAGQEMPQGTVGLTVEILSVLAFIALIAQLLVSARKALFAAAQAQREALESERRAGQLKNEFVSMVSHELRTPLTSIAGFADTLSDSWDGLSSTEVGEFLSILRHETAHLSDLVEDILVIPRLEAGHLRLEPENLDLRAEAFSTASLVFQNSPKEFSVAVPGGVIVHADPVRLKQVMRNLLENARKYGGDQVLVEGEAAGDFYRVSVSDNGPGVPERHQERIFHHFEQLTKGDARSQQGVGLGLPIARTLVRAMGGDLWYEDRFPTGSRFRFTIRLRGHDTHTVDPSVPADSQVA